jgi:hypothetical protein
MALFARSLLTHVEEQRAYNAKLMEVTSAMAEVDTSTVEGIRWLDGWSWRVGPVTGGSLTMVR